MLVNICGCKLNLVQGDITEQQVDAIVNAANSSLAGGGGVDGAIHSAGGPAIMAETDEKYPDGCPTGKAVVSTAGHLSAKYVFHAVGPVWRGGKEGEPVQLQSAYRKCLQLAVKHECESIAFPALSAGAFGYPLDLAANVAIKTVTDFQKWHKAPAEVRFVLFTEGIYGAFARSLETQIELP
ncbi:MAG: O-acetyl-ADP-ribose deacetylase [Planctomycetaceae bacterium]|nr:O-acetyl-ADP-ribose deacetylase [Planctomycetaceae bacterium]